MRIFMTKEYEDMSALAADAIVQQITHKPDSVLGLATGGTPEGTYARLVSEYQAGKVDFSQVKTVNLDEYRGLDANHPQSYHAFMREHLFSHINIPPAHTFLPDGMAQGAEHACAEYEKTIAALGDMDLQLLGIGKNGHIGFNEPGEYFSSETHAVTLDFSTVEANARYFSHMNEVPRQAYTMGIGTIMRARKILLLASGSAKAEILHRAVCGRVKPQVPASILQFHPDVTVICDEAAGAYLKKTPGLRIWRK